MAHTHEVVYQLVHWFDDKVFEQYPTWQDCERGGVFSTPLLEQYFGPLDTNRTGPANYERCVKTGVGRKMVAKMLAGAETDDAIRTALENFPMTERRHLDKGQKIALALEIEPLLAEEARKRQLEAGAYGREGGRGNKKENPGGKCPTRVFEKSRDQAAVAVGISGKLVSAVKVIKEAEKMLRETKTVHEFNARFKRSSCVRTHRTRGR